MNFSDTKLVTKTFPGGISVTGNRASVMHAAEQFGCPEVFEGEYYNSSTHGKILIENMNSKHLKNALKKMLRLNPNVNTEQWRAMVREYLDRDLEDM